MDFIDYDAFVDSLPLDGQFTEIPHTGIPMPIQQKLISRNYLPLDIRFISDTEKLVNACIAGAILGTISLDANKIKALQLKAQVAGLLNSKREQTTEVKEDSTLEDFLRTLGKDVDRVDVQEVSEPAEVTHEATSYKRGLRGHALASIRELNAEIEEWEKK